MAGHEAGDERPGVDPAVSPFDCGMRDAAVYITG